MESGERYAIPISKATQTLFSYIVCAQGTALFVAGDLLTDLAPIVIGRLYLPTQALPPPRIIHLGRRLRHGDSREINFRKSGF